MNHTVKLLIPIGLGLAAALVNSMVLSAQTRSVKFVRASADITRGQSFSEGNLEVLEMPGPEGKSLQNTAVPWSQVGMLLGQRTVRDLVRGDIVFYQDFGVRGAEMNLVPGEAASQISLTGLNIADGTLKIGSHIMLRLRPDEEKEPEWFGPCRLLAVGDRLTNAVLNSGTSRSTASVSTVWVAVPMTPRTESEARLCEALEDFAARQMDQNARVLGVRLIEDTPAAAR